MDHGEGEGSAACVPIQTHLLRGSPGCVFLRSTLLHCSSLLWSSANANKYINLSETARTYHQHQPVICRHVTGCFSFPFQPSTRKWISVFWSGVVKSSSQPTRIFTTSLSVSEWLFFSIFKESYEYAKLCTLSGTAIVVALHFDNVWLMRNIAS